MTKPKKVKVEVQTVEVLPPTYQPTKAEMEQEHRIDATPRQVLQALLRPTKLVYRPVPKREG